MLLCEFWNMARTSTRSRSGGVALLAGCSNAQAEYCAVVSASAEALGVQTHAADFGWAVRLPLCVDRNAEKRMASGAAWGEYATWWCGSCGCKML